MATIGETLRDKREQRGLSIDDVAHETHIHPNMLMGLEENDFSMFASVMYAKSFLRNYADFLEVDTSRMIEALEAGDSYRFGENELMTEMKETIKKDHHLKLERKPWRLRRRATPRKVKVGPPLLLNLILLILIVGLGLFYFLGFQADSLEEAKSEMAKGIRKANPFHREVAEETIEPSPTKPGQSGGDTDAGTKVASAEVSGRTNEASPESALTPEIEKPRVELNLTDGPPSLAASDEEKPKVAPKPRGRMEMTFSEEKLKPLRQDEVPAVGQSDAEPQPVLRPEGTNPETPPAPEPRRGEGGIIHAVPVAGTQ